MTYSPHKSVPLSPIRTTNLSTPIPPAPPPPDTDPDNPYSNADDPLIPPSTSTTSPSSPHAKPSTSLKDLYTRNLGLIYIVIAQLFFSLMGISVKYLISTTSISTLTLILVRMSITSFFCVISLYLMSVPYPILGPPNYRRLLAIRGFFGFTGLFSSYASLRGLSVSDSVTIGFLVPGCTALLGFLWLGEKVGWRELVAGATSLGGVVMISRPHFLFGNVGDKVDGVGGGGVKDKVGEGDEMLRMESVGWALAGVASTAIAYTVIRRIGDKAHALHSIGYFAFLCTTCCSIALLVQTGPVAWPTTLLGFALIIVIGVFGFCGQAFLTLGLMREKAGRAGLGIYLQVLFSITFEFLAFHTVPSFLSVLGTSVILSSALWVALSKETPSSKVIDEETQPLSRSPSPIPPSGTTRGTHYNYSSPPSVDPVIPGPPLDVSLSGTKGKDIRRPSLLVASGSEGRRRSGGSSGGGGR